MRSFAKKVIVGAVAAAMGLSLAGCGSGGASANGDVTLNFTIWDTNQKAGMEQMAAAFTKKNPKIQVKVNVTPWDQYWTKLEAAATGNNMSDVFWMHPQQMQKFAGNNKLMDLTAKIKSDKVDLSKYPETVVKGFTLNDKVYALPKDYSSLALWYNKDLFDAAGVKYPDDTWTWDTWKQAAAKLTDKSKNQFGMLAPNDGQNFYWNLMWANDTDVQNADGTKQTINDKKTQEALTYGIDFIKKGYSPTTAQMANTTPDQYFESGKAAMTVAGSWMPVEYLKVQNNHFGVAPLPTKTKGSTRATMVAGMGFAIPKNCQHPDEAWKFIKFMSGKEASLIQAKSGAAIPAYAGTQGPWVKKFPSIDAQVFVDAAKYGKTPYYSKTYDKWSTIEGEAIGDIFAGKVSVKDGTNQTAKKVQAIMDKG